MSPSPSTRNSTLINYPAYTRPQTHLARYSDDKHLAAVALDIGGGLPEESDELRLVRIRHELCRASFRDISHIWEDRGNLRMREGGSGGV